MSLKIIHFVLFGIQGTQEGQEISFNPANIYKTFKIGP